MRDKRVCVFVDGENFRHSIIDLFEKQFKAYDYLPKADWTKLYDYIVSLAVPNNVHERIRTYWYAIDLLDFFPYRFPDADSDTDCLRKILSIDKIIKEKLNKLASDKVKLVAEMKTIVKYLVERKNGMQSRFRGWREVQDNISINSACIEYRRSGAITYNLFWKRFGDEKAVDVKLAIDLIQLRDIYDVAVIVSGDQDYVPAVQAIKDYGKTTVNVAFLTEDKKLLPGGAWRLNQHTDYSVEIPYKELAQHLNITI